MKRAAAAVVMLAISYVLGQRHRDPHTGTPYEGGIAPTGTDMRIATLLQLAALVRGQARPVKQFVQLIARVLAVRLDAQSCTRNRR